MQRLKLSFRRLDRQTWVLNLYRGLDKSFSWGKQQLQGYCRWHVCKWCLHFVVLRLLRSWTFLNAESIDRSRKSANERRAELGCSASALGWDCLGCNDCCRDSCPRWHFVCFFYFYNDFFALKFETAPFLSFSPEKVLWQINSLITHGFQGPKRWRSNLRRILAQAGKGESRDKPFRTHGFWSQPSEAFCIVLLTSSPFLCRFQDVSSESVV